MPKKSLQIILKVAERDQLYCQGDNSQRMSPFPDLEIDRIWQVLFLKFFLEIQFHAKGLKRCFPRCQPQDAGVRTAQKCQQIT